MLSSFSNNIWEKKLKVNPKSRAITLFLHHNTIAYVFRHILHDFPLTRAYDTRPTQKNYAIHVHG